MSHFIDTHAHLYGSDFETDLPAVMERASQAGACKVFLPPTDYSSLLQVLDVCRRFPSFCYPMIGLHPEDLPKDYEAELDRMQSLLEQDNPFIAIGEVGLDFYWDDSRSEDQMRAFDRQIGWALHYQLPLMIHTRNAHEALLQCLEPYRKENLTGVFHCFTGTVEEAAQLLEFSGFALGIGGVLTFKKSSLPTVLASVPLHRIVLETDSPYMAPVPHRGQRNESGFIPLIAARLAEIYNVSVDEVMEQTTQTALRIFPKSNE